MYTKDVFSDPFPFGYLWVKWPKNSMPAHSEAISLNWKTSSKPDEIFLSRFVCTVAYKTIVYTSFYRVAYGYRVLSVRTLRAATNESQKTRNKKQNGLAHLRFLVCVTPKQKKNIAWFGNQVFSKTCVKQPINNLSQVTWLCTWLVKWDVAD